MVAKAKASNNNDGDFFLPNVRGVCTIERVFQHSGDKGISVILTATIDSCEAKISGATTHRQGAKVKKIYSISKYPTVAPGQLKGDLLAIDGLKEDDLSAKDVEGFLSEIFENNEGAMYELRGYKAQFDTRVIDRKAKGKDNLTGIKFTHMENKPEEVAARAKEISEKLKTQAR